MATITYDVAGQQAVEHINDDLVPFYDGRPGYTVVITEADAAELKGEALHAKAQELGIAGLSKLSADEQRAAIVAATAPAGPLNVPAVVNIEPAETVVGVEPQPVLGDVPDGEVTPAVVVADDGLRAGEHIIVPSDPIDPPGKGTKSRAAADTKEH